MPSVHFFTDFTCNGPYVGELHGAVARIDTGLNRIDLMHDVPAFNVMAGAVLLAQLIRQIPIGDAVVAVVDPGVGTARVPLALKVDGRWLVGPDNGLLDMSLRQAMHSQIHEIKWCPDRLSRSFHGRDLFAPAAARLLGKNPTELAPIPEIQRLADVGSGTHGQVVYVDGYGNLVTSFKPPVGGGVELADQHIAPAGVFGEVAHKNLFCYENSMGLLEVACREGSASRQLGLGVGATVLRKQ